MWRPFESDPVKKPDMILRDDCPDIINLSAGAFAFDPTGLLSLKAFHENRLRHRKGTVLVTAASNQGTGSRTGPRPSRGASRSARSTSSRHASSSAIMVAGWMCTPRGNHLVHAFPAAGTPRASQSLLKNQ